ncbi:uncharacterized protein LOC111342819 [Stylophora pistillata]|uniref:uncharacterized protein LOC111342819 n=1 Tax=Stylophora pistillata TaxID=50429 RepID=UPI000C03CBB3|nr:uncharacterized protein LOC111342819 [Stylophora pistillata]
MNAGKVERRHKIRNREADLAQDRQGKITKQELPVLFLPPVVGDRSSHVKCENNTSLMITMKKLNKRQQNCKHVHQKLSTTALQLQVKEGLFYNCKQDKKRSSCNNKMTFTTKNTFKRPFILPSLPTVAFQGQIRKKAMASQRNPTKPTGYKMFPKYLPRINTKKTPLQSNDTTANGLINVSNTKTIDKSFSPLARKAMKPLRAAISSSATLRGLISLDLEEQFVFRFRLSNYDAKDINITSLNKPE